MAKNKELRNLTHALSEGVLRSFVDVILVFCAVGAEMVEDPRGARSFQRGFAKMDRRMQRLNYDTLKSALQNAQRKGWIKKDLTLTREGQRRLQDLMPNKYEFRKWDGKWYIVTFDVPEQSRRARDILREHLQRLGFGKLQNSVWISPYPFLGDVERVIKERRLESFVILSISEQVGQEDSRELAGRIWNLYPLNQRYEKFVNDFKKEKRSRWAAVMQFQGIFQSDPRLPKELLPEDWAGEQAFSLYLQYRK